MKLKFGVLWPFRNPEFNRVPWTDLYRTHLDLIVDSEAMGFEYAWLTEHHFVDDGYSPSLLPIAAGIATRTSRIRIGTFLVLLPLHNPVRIAEDTATVDLMSNGRFELGVGLGYRRKEFADQGITHKERGSRLQEGIDIVQRLLMNESVTIEGQHTFLRDIKISPPAVQTPHPPIWLGAIAEKAIQRAAKMGFNFQAVGPADMYKVYDEALEANGRNPQDYSIAQMRFIYCARSREQAWEIAAEPLHYTATKYAQWFAEANDKPGDDQATEGIPSVDEIIAKQHFNVFGEDAIVGTPEDCREMIADYASRSRFTHLVCASAPAGMSPLHIREGLQLFASDVIPAFKN
ncbi:MAG: LLM class flavin-dependent oxidoreductase [Pseudomonadota bacterium]